MRNIDYRSLEGEFRPLCVSGIWCLGVYYSRCSPFHWDSVWSRGIDELKRMSLPFIEAFGGLLGHFVGSRFPRVDMIVPVPCFFQRESVLFETEHNYPSLAVSRMASQSSGKSGLLVAEVLFQEKRKRKKQKQCSSDRERRENVRSAYRYNREICLMGRSVALVDDVMTSGATLLSCSRELRSSGVSDVALLALAKTYRKSLNCKE